MVEIRDKELHRIAVTAIIYDKERKFLVTQRALHEEYWPGEWTVPGGRITTDDYINTPLTHKNQWYFAVSNALKREVKEEVGVEIGKPEYLLDLTFIKNNGVPVLALSYFAQYLRGKVTLDKDSISFAWISADKIPNYDFIEGVDEEIRMVDEILQKRQLLS